MTKTGLVLLAVGALWELDIYRRGAWPIGLTWIMMAAGVILTLAGVVRARRNGGAG